MTRAEAFAFVAGGTVQAGGGVYLERQADHELLEHCRAGNFSYILTSRQMGKSSLMIRTAERLTAEGARPVIVDLTEFGAQTSAEQWYKGFLSTLQDQLQLHVQVSEWWAAQSDHAFGHRFTRFLREVVLAERSERLVIFVDEIDTTLRLDFTDDFFTAIRFLYQHRAAEPALERLSFVLIGVATPGDLIKDVARTPFNIGHRIDLTDFTLDEASRLTEHLPMVGTAAKEVVGWVLRWTGGHPYLTLRTIRSLAESPPPAWTAAAVDERVHALYLAEGAETDSNLQFVRDMLTKKAFNREAVLRTYERVRRGEQVPDLELDQVTSWLKLSGIVVSRNHWLRVRNPIYEHVFDVRWAHEHARLNVNWRRRLARLAAVLLVLVGLVTIPFAIYAWQQKVEAEYQTRVAQLERDEATAQRLLAEKSLATARVSQQTANAAVDELKRYNPASAEALAGEAAKAEQDLQKTVNELTAKLRAEKDELARKLDAATRQLNARDSSTRPERPGNPPPAAGQTAAPAPRPRAADEEAIHRTLGSLETAYQTRNIENVRRVRPLTSQEAKALQSDFSYALDYTVTFDKVDIQFSSDRQATVTAMQNVANLVPTSGQKTNMKTSKALVTFIMEKRGNWTITRVR